MTTTRQHGARTTPAAPAEPESGTSWVLTDWHDPRPRALHAAMDAEVGPRYAELRGGRTPPGRPTGEDVAEVVLALVEGVPAATGTLRRLPDRWEVKRLFVGPEHRRLGLARQVLARVEDAARRHGAGELFLQAGNRQPDAIALYERSGWARTEVFAPYDPADGISVCFRKEL